MNLIKIKCECEFEGTEYNGVAVQDGVNVTIADGCDPQLGKVITFSVQSPVLPVSAVTSYSVGSGVPKGYLVLKVPKK